MTERPERHMVRRALVAGGLAAPVALGLGAAAGGLGAGTSALVAVAVVTLNFAAHGWSLAWAAGVSVGTVQAVALGGFALRMGAIVGLLFALDPVAWFSPAVFGVTAVTGTMALLAYEAKLVSAGLGRDLDVPPDPAAVEANRQLRLRELAR